MPERSSAEPFGEQSSRPKVLVVDDMPANLALAEAILEPLFCEVLVARSGREALTVIQDHEVAVLLLDVQMPGMDGYEVANRVRQDPKTRKVPIIFQTAASVGDENVLRGYGSGAVDFLFKPISATILRSKIQVFLELYQSQRRIMDAKQDLERAYAELKSTQAQLVQSAKMASLGELVAGIAHELNNPLAFVLSHVGTAKRSLDKAERLPASPFLKLAEEDWSRAMNRLSETSSGLERIRDLVLKLRVFSRIDEGERKSVSIRESIESVLLILVYRLQEGITVERQYGPDDVVECYPSLLNQAILNVLVNAIDAIEENGSVTIRTGVNDLGHFIRITDNGPGIPAELRERVVEPFFTTKAPGKGTGLGLSITYSIMQKHGGALEFDCPPGEGTTVTLTLPGTVGRGGRT